MTEMKELGALIFNEIEMNAGLLPTNDCVQWNTVFTELKSDDGGPGSILYDDLFYSSYSRARYMLLVYVCELCATVFFKVTCA